MTSDTIFALSSGMPPAGIAVMRVSGPGAGAALQRLAGRMPPPRTARLAALRDDEGGLLDRALILWFPGPGTATGEDLAELHLHGGRAVVAAVERALAAMAGLRRAEPGEFTRRAFANGRLDLAETEGLADLLTAETETQRRNALALAGGAFSRRIEAWRERVLMAAARVEAMLDFSDEDDVEPADPAPAIRALLGEIDEALSVPPVERLRDGIRVAIAGPPNAGKSTLLNAIVGREAAITSPIAGTTRDVIEAPVSLDGIPFLFRDTAGLRTSDDPVERVGVERAAVVMASADIVLWLGESEDAPAGALWLHPRADARGEAPAGALPVSAMTGSGMDALRRKLLARAGSLLPAKGETALHRRHIECLEECRAGLSEAIASKDLLIVAEGLRRARVALDALQGRAGTEDMLDALFGRFCIGK